MGRSNPLLNRHSITIWNSIECKPTQNTFLSLKKAAIWWSNGLEMRALLGTIHYVSKIRDDLTAKEKAPQDSRLEHECSDMIKFEPN